MTPHKCPACDGYGKRARKPGGKRKKCLACQGSCIVWEGAPSYRPAPYYWHSPYWYGNSTLGGVVLCSNDGTATSDLTGVTAYNGDFAAEDLTATSFSTADVTWTVS